MTVAYDCIADSSDGNKAQEEVNLKTNNTSLWSTHLTHLIQSYRGVFSQITILPHGEIENERSHSESIIHQAHELFPISRVETIQQAKHVDRRVQNVDDQDAYLPPLSR